MLDYWVNPLEPRRTLAGVTLHTIRGQPDAAFLVVVVVVVVLLVAVVLVVMVVV